MPKFDFSINERAILRTAVNELLSSGWTQKELARALEVEQQTIGSYKSGAKSPSRTTAELLAKVIGKPLEVILSTPETAPRVVESDRYPRMEEAIALAATARERAVERMRLKMYSGAEAWPVSWWLRELETIEDEERRLDEDPARVTRERAEHETAAAEDERRALDEQARKVEALRKRKK